MKEFEIPFALGEWVRVIQGGHIGETGFITAINKQKNLVRIKTETEPLWFYSFKLEPFSN